jgi:plasmid stability protein
MVRNVDEAVVRELKRRAVRRNHSAEQEHREILEQALLRPKRRSLVDTDVISNARKRTRANPGVRRFFQAAAAQSTPLFLSAVTISELWQGVEAVRHRGDLAQANRLGRWPTGVAVLNPFT